MHKDVKTRTTLTLDQDVFDLVRREAAEKRRRFGEVLNERLRMSFAQKAPGRKHSSSFAVKPFPAGGFAPGIDEGKLNQLLDTLEAQGGKQ